MNTVDTQADLFQGLTIWDKSSSISVWKEKMSQASELCCRIGVCVDTRRAHLIVIEI